ncbi:TPR repeat-containing protein [Humidesulfovibrio mexicanus]|uniref:TPR repeat-containing protein n=1 Tax=Humidesulfovibrio mexicanus TaxID=147047 RepID=A0A239AZJ1_9BACT|nr:tetratricopeptide repeat protein [Humidesulfovibrio mexicanus]SNS01125.1 TPR repeat-containing protein [Humidesulfovibrio mexicanus]
MTDTIDRHAPLSGGQKFILFALLAVIVTMFVGSFVYRMKGGGLVVEVHQERGGMGGASAMGGPMAGMMGVDMEQLRELMRRVEQNPNDAKVLLELANTFMMMQAWDKALEFAQMAAKAEPGNPDAHRAMGMVRFERKEYAEAKKSFDIVLKAAPDDALAHYNMGILLKHYMQKSAEGDAHFRRVVQLNPKDSDVLKSAQEELAAGKGQ